ncbi:MAG: extracellular solute-binding protein [Nostocoides sp.]
MTTQRWERRCLTAVAIVCVLFAAACASTASPGSNASSATSVGPASSITLYTSVTQKTVDAVTAGYRLAHPGATVTVFRAATGQLNARIAADVRSGGLKADVIWGTDPLSMQSYTDQSLLAPWPLPRLTSVPAQYRTPQFWGTRLLYLVMVTHHGLRPAPTSWADLTSPAYAGKVAVPDPAFAGSAFAALGYFSQTEGMGYYRALRANGARQVASIPDVVTQVAQGRFSVGITLDSGIREAIAKGSPVDLVWPKPGAIALYSPIALTTASAHTAAATDFLGYVLSTDGQQRIAATGWQPIVPGVPGPPQPAGAQTVTPDWAALFGHQAQLLEQYRSVFVK